jgi:hypothetical protein
MQDFFTAVNDWIARRQICRRSVEQPFIQGNFYLFLLIGLATAGYNRLVFRRLN